MNDWSSLFHCSLTYPSEHPAKFDSHLGRIIPIFITPKTLITNYVQNNVSQTHKVIWQKQVGLEVEDMGKESQIPGMGS